MRIFKVLICFLLLLCVSGCKMLEQRKETEEIIDLNSEFEWTIGDWIAYRLSLEYSAVYRMFGFGINEGGGIPGFVHAIYDRDKSVIILEMRGMEKTPKKAKEGIRLLVNEVEDEHIPRFNRECRIDLKRIDFQVIYLDIERGREIVRWEDGKYLLPED